MVCVVVRRQVNSGMEPQPQLLASAQRHSREHRYWKRRLRCWEQQQKKGEGDERVRVFLKAALLHYWLRSRQVG